MLWGNPGRKGCSLSVVASLVVSFICASEEMMDILILLYL